jgi:hypothetical protein
MTRPVEFPQHPSFCECDECLGLDEDGELLDGSTRSAVRLLTGFTDEELNELGGFDEDRPRGITW